MIALLLSAIVSSVVSGITIRWLRDRAGRIGLIDRPNERSSHRSPTPRGGGIGIMLGATAGLIVGALYRPPGTAILVVFGAALAVAAIGLVDDVRRLRPGTKLVVHVLAASVVVAAVGPMQTLPLPEPIAFEIPSRMVAWALTLLWLCAVTNFFNFMDGIDGLAGGQATVSMIGVLLAGWSADASLVAVCVAAATIGFLMHNWSPARIFMGDVGSGFLGFLLAALPLAAPPDDRGRATLAVAVGLTLFLADPVETLIRRGRAGRKLTSAHREHTYQHLVAPGEAAGPIASRLVAAGLGLSVLGAVAFRQPRLAWVAVAICGCAYAIERAAARKHHAPLRS